MSIEILALDLAGRSGYALKYTSGQIRVGVLNIARGLLSGTRDPLPMVRLSRRLDLLSEWQYVDRVIFEETFARGHAKYRLDSLQHAVILWAIRNEVVWRRVPPTEWKKAMLGNGRATKHEYTVAALEQFPERMWTDDQCAARWLLEYGLKEV